MTAVDDLLGGLTPGLIWSSQNASAAAAQEYWRELESLYPSGHTMPRVPALITTTSLSPSTSGTLYLYGGLLLRPDVEVTGAAFWSSGTAAVNPTNQWASLVDARDLSVLAKSADKTTEAWAANSKKAFVFTGYTPDEFVPAYLGLCQVAATNATLFGVNLGGATRPNAEAPILSGTSTTGLTDPASLGATAAALTAFNGHAYGYVT